MKLAAVLLHLLVLSSCFTIHHPDPNLFQRPGDFDSSWKVSPDKGIAASSSSYDDSSWHEVNSPFYLSDLVQDQDSIPGAIWLRKTFTFEKESPAKIVHLFFNAMYMSTEVYVNGMKAASNPNGHVPFSTDITGLLNPHGEENVVAVRLSPQDYADPVWTNRAGVCGEIHMFVSESLYLTKPGIRTAELTSTSALVSVTSNVVNDYESMATFSLSVLISDLSGKTVATRMVESSVDVHSSAKVEIPIIIDDPVLWDVDSPGLYMMDICLYRDGTLVDQFAAPFGVRSISFDDKAFIINGKKVEPIVAGYLDPIPRSAENQYIRALKQKGFNTLWVFGSPPASLLSACDTEGMLVIENYTSLPKEQCTLSSISQQAGSLIDRDIIHPSVVMWSANVMDNDACGDPCDDGFLKEVYDMVGRCDETRPLLRDVSGPLLDRVTLLVDMD